MSAGPNLSGLCMCGCGERTRIAKKTANRYGQVKGQPMRFLPGHQFRLEENQKQTKPNRFEHRPDGTTVIFLEMKKKILECVIDTTDYELVRQHHWHATSRRDETHYSITGNPGIKMENLLLPPKDGMTPDHRDRNGLNNRRCNLRYATKSQQTTNQFRRNASKTSKYRGVSWNRDTQKYRVLIQINGRKTHGGLFESEEDAARKYDELARKHFGEFASLNFPNKQEIPCNEGIDPK